MSLDRLMEYLRNIEETQVIDLLGLTTEDILSRFEDIIIERRPFIERELEIIQDDNNELDFEDD